MRGLIPIHAFQQRMRFIEKFIKTLNIALRGNICFVSLERSFGVTVYYVTVLILIIGMELAAININEENSYQYGVQILFLIRMVLVVQILLRQIITGESLMISSERALILANLPSEKGLTTTYDEENHLN